MLIPVRHALQKKGVPRRPLVLHYIFCARSITTISLIRLVKEGVNLQFAYVRTFDVKKAQINFATKNLK